MTVVILASVILDAVLNVLTDLLELRNDWGVAEEDTAAEGTPGMVARPLVPTTDTHTHTHNHTNYTRFF